MILCLLSSLTIQKLHNPLNLLSTFIRTQKKHIFALIHPPLLTQSVILQLLLEDEQGRLAMELSEVGYYQELVIK